MSSFSEKMKTRAEKNPALIFITEPAAEGPPDPGAEASASAAPMQKRAPQRKEAKTRRLQLLLQPSLYDAVRARAEAEGLSVNEEIGALLRSALHIREE